MKTIVIILLVCVRAAFPDPGFRGSENFKRVFPDAVIKHVTTSGDVTTVQFSWKGDSDLSAWFDGKGELVAISELIDSRTLPISIRMHLGQEYVGFAVLQVREFYHLEKGLSYFLIVKKGEKALILRAETDGQISTSKKLKPEW